MTPTLSLNPLTDLDRLTTFPFMVHALQAGTIVAVLSAVVGWFMVLRRQSFAGHTLAVMAFPGAAGAALAGLPTSLGYYVASTGAALTIGRGQTGSPSSETATVGTVQTAGLAAGFLFLELNRSILGGPETLLFGTFLGISAGQVTGLLVLAVIALLLLAVIARPLLFATVDPDVARSRGVPVRGLGVLFLLMLGLAVAAASQITGVLLVFALLVAPAAAAQRVTLRPLPGLALSVGFSLLIAWGGLGVAYFSPYPVGFWLTTLAFGLYVLVRIATHVFARVRS